MKSVLIAVALVALPAATLAQEATPVSSEGPAAAVRLPDPFAPRASGSAPAPASAPGTPAAPQPVNAASEALLRGVIGGLQTGQLDYSKMTPNLAEQWRTKEAEYLTLVRTFGALERVDLLGNQGGADVYAVAFAHTETQWLVGVNEEGKIAALLFRPVEDAPADEAADDAN